MHFNYVDYDALALADLIKTRQITPEEVLNAAIYQIELTNPKLNAVNVKLYEQAYQQLSMIDMQAPFAGVPMLIKDLLADYAGIPTSYGSQWLRYIPVLNDSELVARYKRAGFIIIGKTNVPEFGLGAITEPKAFGATHNPWHSEYTPGGSSGGSAAAVAARMVPLAHANDGGGSIRIPASCCGLFGLKPGRGVTPTGAKPFSSNSNSLITEHVLTRTVRDSAAVLDISASASITKITSLKRLRVGYIAQGIFTRAAIDEDSAAALEQTIKYCETLGHQLSAIQLPIPIKRLQNAYMVIATSELYNSLQLFTQRAGIKPGRQDLEVMTRVFAIIGGRYTAIEITEAVKTMHEVSSELNRLFQTTDVILTPVLARAPVKLGFFQPLWYEQSLLNILAEFPLNFILNIIQKEMARKIFDYVAFTPLCNLSGHPAMSVPLYWSKTGLPIGSHFIGRMQEESTLLALASELEEAYPWRALYKKNQ